MRIAVTGSSGMVGSHLLGFLEKAGHDVIRLVRNPTSFSARNEVVWDPEGQAMDLAGLEGCDAVVHLAGENIATGRWTDAKKRRIHDSRAEGTRILSESIARLTSRPSVLVSASAIGWYGDRGDEELNERSTPGDDFLSGVCGAWEKATLPARNAGIRVVNLRLGVILCKDGGALGKMLMPFRFGLGGNIGDGKQYMSWIGIDDLVEIIKLAITNSNYAGPVNVVAPTPVTNAEFTKTLGKVLGRPTLIPLPAFAARLALGEMADALLLSSARVIPAQLLANKYDYRHPELEGALRHLLAKN